MVITIDGPVAAGKTTVARRLGARLGWCLLDTGAIYRCVALDSQRQGLDWHDETAMSRVADQLEIDFRPQDNTHRVFLANTDVTADIRQPEISRGASIVSALPGVRSALLEVQRQQASRGHLIAEGRDTGTVVFPEAELKFFLTATPEIRARRRFLELQDEGLAADLQDVLAELRERDHRDSNRPIAPLAAAPDAVVIESSSMSADEVVVTMHSHASSDLVAERR